MAVPPTEARTKGKVGEAVLRYLLSSDPKDFKNHLNAQEPYSLLEGAISPYFYVTGKIGSMVALLVSVTSHVP